MLSQGSQNILKEHMYYFLVFCSYKLQQFQGNNLALLSQILVQFVLETSHWLLFDEETLAMACFALNQLILSSYEFQQLTPLIITEEMVQKMVFD